MEPQRPSADLVANMLRESIAEANAGVTHADFAAGAQSGTMAFKCMIGEPQQFLRGKRKAIFSIFVVFYTIAPLILVSIWAYHERNA